MNALAESAKLMPMRPVALALLAVLACACTDGRTHDAPVPATKPEPHLVATPEPEPEPEPVREPTVCGTLPSMNAIGQLGELELTFGLAYPPIGVSRDELPAGLRWQVPLDPPDGPTASLTITKAELATPESLDEARSRLEPLELEELDASATNKGLLFVRTDPRRSSLAIDYFTTIGELAVLCTVRLDGDAPIPEFPDHLERLSHACTSLHLWPETTGALGKIGLSQQP
jgi:hypothetical protein